MLLMLWILPKDTAIKHIEHLFAHDKIRETLRMVMCFPRVTHSPFIDSTSDQVKFITLHCVVTSQYQFRQSKTQFSTKPNFRISGTLYNIEELILELCTYSPGRLDRLLEQIYILMCTM